MKILRAACFLLVSLFPVHGESLWDAGFGGYLSKTNTLAVGDVVTVTISSDFTLSFVSSTVDSKLLTMEFSGGEYPDLFSFMPVARSGNQSNVRGREDRTLRSDVVARVTRIVSPNQVAIEGTKSVTIDGKSESITLTGTINPQDVGTDRKIDFSKVADSRLTLKTLIEPSQDILTANDIQEVISGLSEGTTYETGATPGPGEQLGTGGTPAPQQAKKYALSEAKKKELFLRYVNKIIDLIF
jgi:hypothetical protein